MGIRKLSLLLCMIVLFAASVQAVNVNIQSEAVENNIFADELAELTLTIENREDRDLRFSLQATDIEWTMHTEPATHASKFEVAAGESATTRIFLTPTNKQIQAGLHGVRLDITDLDGKDRTRTHVFINIKPKDPLSGEYLPSVRATLVMDDTRIDPRQATSITVQVENLNPRDIPELNVTLASESISEARTVSLGGKGSEGDTKSVVFSLDLDDIHLAGSEHMKAILLTTAQGKPFTFETQPVAFEIIHYGGVEEHIETDSFLFKTTQTHTLSNTGNAKETGTVRIPYGFFDRMFVSAPEGETIREGLRTYRVVEEELDPSATATVVVVYNYQWLALLIVLIVLGTGAYYRFRSPVILRKETRVLDKMEGGISNVKVMLVVRNRSRKDMRNVSISDKLPHLVEISKEFEMGVLQPSKILRHKSKGTIVKWELEHLDAGEERIMTYHIHAKLSILGKIQLPGGIVKFTGDKGRTRTFTSQANWISSF